jgi:glycosyltransferase involved in cell wall biosynthesis
MGGLRVGFVLCSSTANPVPSTRVAISNMLPFLRAAGMEPSILFEPEHPTETPDLSGIAASAVAQAFDVVVFQKVHGPSAVALARQLSAAGTRTVFCVCDLVNSAMAEATSTTAVISDFLQSLYPASLQPRIHVVHDGIERPDDHKNDWGDGSGTSSRPLRAVLVTSASMDRVPVLNHPPAWLKLRIVGRYSSGFTRLREIRWTWAGKDAAERRDYLRFLTDPRIACVPWSADGVYAEMRQADIGIIPIDTPPAPPGAPTPAWMIKSENRLTMKMAMGLPVIATPIPSYEAVIEHGVNGFFARSLDDWRQCLAALRDPARRKAMGLAARASVEQRYSMRAQADKLVRVLQGSDGAGAAGAGR